MLTNQTTKASRKGLAMLGVRKAAGPPPYLRHSLHGLHGLAAAKIRSTQTTVRQYCTDGCVYWRSCATRDSYMRVCV